jgi:DNA-directed RNA polymerase specialized sigma subunit
MKKKNKNNIFKEKNITEEEFLDAVDKISKKLIYKFKFGYHEIEDMKQQATIFALQGLKNYDSSRPLENFLWTHVRNRLFNFKRDNYYRPDNVCIGCKYYDPDMKKSSNQCAKFSDKNECEIYSSSLNRNTIRKNLMKPNHIDTEHNNIRPTNNISNIITNEEILQIIEDNIDTKFRMSYLKLKGGDKILRSELVKLQNHIYGILEKFNLDKDNFNG